MSKAQNSKEAEQPIVEVQIVGDEVATVYGLTVGEIVSDRDSLYKQLQAANKSIDEKNAALLAQSERIEELEKTAAVPSLVVSGPLPSPRAEDMRPGKIEFMPHVGMVRLPDGSIRLPITIPVDAAVPLLSWAEGAGEEPTGYIQKQVEEALLAVVGS